MATLNYQYAYSPTDFSGQHPFSSLDTVSAMHGVVLQLSKLYAYVLEWLVFYANEILICA